MFTDRVRLTLSAGKGGNGVVAWRREKYIPKGGPTGGDGGNGASIFIETTEASHSLEEFRNHRIVKAQNGAPGGSNYCKGKNGRDLILRVPLGTLVKDADTGEVLFDFTEKKQSWTPCKGGKGGKGNAQFKSSTHQAPNICTEGTPGQIREVELELKLIADVGFVGMPNAGKSTLIKELAHVSVKIAPYPFTTLRPNLGLIEFDDFSRILIADIPGIIESAHQNKGLGFSFLRHIERSSTLVFVIELTPWEPNRDPFEEFCTLRKELEAYNPSLLEKPFLVALNKTDIEGSFELVEKFQSQYPFDPQTLFAISASTGTNTPSLKDAIRKLAQRDGKRF